MTDIEQFRKDVKRYIDFLQSVNIDVCSEDVSLEFMLVMFQFSKIEGTSNYKKAICYYIAHMLKYPRIKDAVSE